MYVAIGVLGAPIFAGMEFGWAAIFGPRGGYLLGFILTSFVVGYLVDNYFKNLKFFHILFILSLIYTVCIYGIGCLGLGLWLYVLKGSWPTLSEVFIMGVLPFIPGDVIKIFVASVVSTVVLPKK